MTTKCTGLNCGTTTGDHSPECRAEHAAAVAGGRFVKSSAPAVDSGSFPDLPIPRVTYADHSYPAFSKQQMIGYARAALSASTEAAAGVTIDTLRKGFKTTRVCGPDNLYEISIKYRSIEDLHAADDELRALMQSAITTPPAATLHKLTDALQRLENACDKIARLRTREQYLSMIDGGQQDALIELDNARFEARALLSDSATASDKEGA